MNKSQKKKKTLEDQLADFTDNILSENTAEVNENSFTSDPELRDLQQTALHLKNTFHEDGPSEIVIQRMHKNIIRQWRQQENKASKPLWNKFLSFFQPPNQGWKSQRSRQQLSMMSFAVMVLMVFFISIFFFNGVYSDQPAAGGHNLGVDFLVAVFGAILFTIWLFRRKQ